MALSGHSRAVGSTLLASCDYIVFERAERCILGYCCNLQRLMVLLFFLTPKLVDHSNSIIDIILFLVHLLWQPRNLQPYCQPLYHFQQCAPAAK